MNEFLFTFFLNIQEANLGLVVPVEIKTFDIKYDAPAFLRPSG